ncbi:MAG: 16S rRNA (adenine(1518)-N(6)/adenine(1519)-N(6))-dimethyltransferase RsmA, partial [Acholeplasmataceae bacterium]
MKAKKHYGQNFLKSESIILKIIQSNDILNEVVIEIGPGRGALTKHLVMAKALIAFEIDQSLKPLLDDLVKGHNAQILYEDILNIDLNQFLKDRGIDKCIIIANIPYYITGPILQLIANTTQVSSATLMVQKEVGDRLLASSGKTYGALSVLMAYKFDIEKITHVKNTAFYPVPKVDSVVVKLTKTSRYTNRIIDEEKFISFVKNAFMQKRKTLINNLAATYKISKDEVLNNLKEIDEDINPLIRAENVSIE